jgi:hypothetical protein
MLIASAQKQLGVLCSSSIVLAISARVRFFVPRLHSIEEHTGQKIANQQYAQGKTD